ncbi:MAG TPA: NAD(+) diphosphatase [Patescibacteria group bacterium]|nr:NAD(+) diphosphatase [Patescibacteria group bacterium]
MTFELRALPFPSEEEKSFYLLFFGDKLLVEEKDDSINILDKSSLYKYSLVTNDHLYLGRLNSLPYIAADLPSIEIMDSSLKLIGLRQLFGLIEDDLFWLAARAYHLINWNKNTCYCGRCGAETFMKESEHSKYCSKCGLALYPKISPAVIVAVTKKDEILLAKNALNKSGFYSVLAGFVEPGENLEECVAREIQEEAGISVKNIQYFGSQPWPFPDSLMIGFTAEYDCGELVIDKQELSDAKWFKANELPEIPGKLSIARKLIDWFAEASFKAHK